MSVQSQMVHIADSLTFHRLSIRVGAICRGWGTIVWFYGGAGFF